MLQKIRLTKNLPIKILSPRADIAVINNSLRIYDAVQIIVGHTILERNIAMYYRGKVIGIDLDVHQYHSAALTYKSGKWNIGDRNGKQQELKYSQKNDKIIDTDIL